MKTHCNWHCLRCSHIRDSVTCGVRNSEYLALDIQCRFYGEGVIVKPGKVHHGIRFENKGKLDIVNNIESDTY